MPGAVHHFDPSRLQVTSKFIDPEYAPKAVVLPAISRLMRPLPGRLWHDKACNQWIERRFSARRIQFAHTLARTIDYPLLTKEMILFDENRMYLDTSIRLEYSADDYLPEVTKQCAEAITASAGAPVDERFSNDTLLISYNEGGGTWGHHLLQNIPRMLLFLDAFPSGKIAVPIWQAEGAPGYEEALAFYNIAPSYAETLTLYNIPKERIAPVDAGTVYRFKQVILLDYLFNFEIGTPHPKVLPLLRTPRRPAARGGKKAAFIKRRIESRRAIGNEGAVDGVMERHGIDVYGADELPLRAQIELWQSYDLVIATLGSDLTNMVYARRGTRVLVLAPHWFGDGFFFELSVAAGVQWHELRCGHMTWRDEEEERFSSFAIDVRLLDFILTSLLQLNL